MCIRDRNIPPLPAGGALGEKPAAPLLELEPAAGRLWQCLVTIDAQAEFPGARAALVIRRLEKLGQIVGTTPEREALQNPQFDGRITVDLVTERPEAAILSAVKDLLDLKRFEVREPPAAPPAPLSDTSDSTQS